MKKKFLGRVLTMLLVASMVFTLLPAPAIAAGNWWWNNEAYTEEAVPTATTDNSNFMRIFHLDCGRKYFSVTEIEGIIDQLAAKNYTHIELAFGNDGLRFLLDDMSLTVGTTTYDSQSVSAAIQAGNKDYYNAGEYNELTESQMTDIINYAKDRNIGVIPLIDIPGHTNALVYAMKKLGISERYYVSNKNSTGRDTLALDVKDTAAVSFATELVKKYVDYFAANGAAYFNVGADECGYGDYAEADYQALAAMIGPLSDYIYSKKMTTLIFNDGFRTNGYLQTALREKSNQIKVCYWTYSEYTRPTDLAQNFELINTHNKWYYVAGKEGGQWYGYEWAKSNLNGTYKDCAIVDGAENENYRTNTGCMLAYWCDDPSKSYNASNVADLIKTLADNNPDYFKTTAAPDKPGTKLEERTIDVTVGGTATDTIEGNYLNTYEPKPAGFATVETTIKAAGTGGVKVGDKIAVNNKNLPATVTGVISDGNGNYMMVSGNTIKNTKNVSDATQFTVTRLQNGTNGYKYRINSGDKYLKIDISGVTISSYYDNNRYGTNGFCYSARYGSYYLYYSNYDGWTSNYGNGNGFLYATVEEGTSEQTLVTFYGLAEGTTYVTIGNVYYTIHVTKEDLSKAPTLPIQLWITNNSIEVDGAKQTTGSFANGGWQDKPWYLLLNAKDNAAVASSEGLPLAECIPATIEDRYQYNTTYWKSIHADAGPENKIPYDFVVWKGKVLNQSTGLQLAGNTSRVNAGADNDFQYIRYYGGKWQVSADRVNWKKVTGDGTMSSYTDCSEQIVAYYKMRTVLTDEVTTDVVDWGDPVKNQDKYALLDFAVKYPSGTRVPDKFIQPEKTRVYYIEGNVGLDGNYRLIDEISVVNKQGFEVYMITLTPATGLSGKISSTTQYQYEKTGEKVVWVDKVEDLPDDFKDSDRWYVALTNTGASRGLTFNAKNGTNVGGDAIVPMVEIEKNSGTLVTYYIRPVKEETETLQVNYVDLSDNRVFYDYSIAVKSGTTFEKEPTLTNGKLEDYTIEGLKVTETVYSDLTKMDGVPAAYRYATNITCERVERSEGNKTLTLYYRFGRTTSFVVDFGLPVTIQPGDLNTTLGTNIDRITKVTAVSSDGTASVVGKNVVFTPNKVYGVGSAKLAITYSGTNLVNNEENSVTYTVDILPASNVLYEENFLTETNESGLSWTKVTSDKLGSQETQKAKADGNVFGYDAAYVGNSTNPVTGELGAWKLGSEQNPLQDNTFYASCLTTEFYGNGFDLIGNCGPTTGRVSVLIAGKNGGYIYDVDTRYNDGKNTTLYQVPLMHIDLHDEGIYTVKVYGSGLAKTTVSPASYSLSGAATYASDYAVGGYDTVLSDILAENGLTMADVEYVKVESAPAATTRSAASFYALDTAAETGTVTHEAGKHVEIDGFRVYRSTDNDNYPANEKNVTYENILDVVDRKFVAYTETNGNFNATVETYEAAGGPQNEIYLGKDQAVTFAIENVNSIQVSLRAVNGTAKWNGYDITSNTEMYYELTAENGVFTIANSGDNLLAIGNVKIPGNAGGIQTASELPAEVVLASVRMALGASGEGDTFDPAISAKVTTTRFIRSKVVTLTVSASADVEKLMVNGVELRPTNSWLVKMGWSDTYTYILTEKVQKNEIKTYEIVGYRADGAASAPIVVESK